MKKFIGICLIMIVCCTLSLGDVAAKELVFSTAAVPAAPHAKGQIKFAEEVERLTNGELVVKTYQGGELFTQEAQNTAIRRGTLDMTLLGPNWFTEYAPFMNMFATAYFFKTLEHMNAVMGGEIGSEIYDRLAQAVGVRPISCWYLGTRQLNLRDIGKVVTTPADMDGVKLRMPNSKTWLMMGEALGANPTPVSISELYLALQTGTVDGQDNPLTTVVVRKFHEVTKHIILTGHYVNPIMPVVNEKTWQSLSPEHQQALLEAAEIARQFVEDTVVGSTDEAAQTIKDAGVEFVEVDTEVWRQHALDYYNGKDDFVSAYDMELFEKIQALAE
jgi:TRAP-type transport system periplasmic protein